MVSRLGVIALLNAFAKMGAVLSKQINGMSAGVNKLECIMSKFVCVTWVWIAETRTTIMCLAQKTSWMC